jgi:hypothetical protein
MHALGYENILEGGMEQGRIQMAVLVTSTSMLLAFGCATMKMAHLYTADGQVVEAEFTYSGNGRGTVKVTLPDGEAFTGEYFTVANIGLSTSALITPWGPITSVSVSQAGQQVSHITAVGSRGTQLTCVSFPRGSHGFGGCRDSKAREYRLHY